MQVEEWVETNNGAYAKLADGHGVFVKHLCPIEHMAPDFVAVAESLEGRPYQWAGKSGLGLDCSSLVQLALRMAGIRALRDSDMQGGTLGQVLPDDTTIENLKRGDFVFWKGHVGIVNGSNSLIHANAFSMQVTIEPLDEAVERIERLYARPTSYRRLP